MMWCLSRKPLDSSSSSSSKDLIFSRTSIFSCECGFFEDVSLLIIDDDQRQEDGNFPGNALKNDQNPWKWFAYECTPMQFVAVCVPQKTQIISILPNYFVCAQMIFPPKEPKSKEKPEPYSKLCAYMRKSNELFDLPSCMELKERKFRDLFTAACALIDGWLYVAGGYLATASFAEEKPPVPLNSAERLNLNTLKWETLPKMLKPCANSTGIAHGGRFYVIGDKNIGHSAQIYYPATKYWLLTTQFIPQEANGYTVGSVDGRMILLTWSGYRGVKLWHWVEDFSMSAGRWQLLQFYAPYKVERVRIYENRVRLVTIGKEVFIMVGANRHFCWVDGLRAWPVLPPPFFRPCDSQGVYRSESVRAFRISRRGNRLSWRRYPVYRVGSRR